MKRSAAALALFVAATAFAQQRTITVSGNGRAPVTPDRVQFTVGVLTRSGSVADGVRDSNEKTRRVIDALKAKGVAASEIRTSNFSLQQPCGVEERIAAEGPPIESGVQVVAATVVVTFELK